MARILYVTDGISPWVIGGMQIVSRTHLGWLREAGHDAIVVSSRMLPLNEINFASSIICLPFPNASLLGKLNLWNYQQHLKAFSEMVCEVADKVRPDLVYSEGPLVYSYLKRAKHDRVPLIFHPHGLEMFQKTGSRFLDFRLLPLRSLVQKHVSGADFIISQGGHLTNILTKDIGAEMEKIIYLPNCTPTGFSISKFARHSQKGRFLFIGRNEIRKGLPQLLSAFKKIPGGSLRVVGEIPKNIEPQRGVTFQGPIHDRSELHAFFDESDFLVTPSFAEGMPTVILEAFASAMPVIATDVGAIPIVVRDGESGFLVAPGDPRALTSALRRSIDLNDQVYQKMSTRALELATTDFSPERVRDIFLSLIKMAIRLGKGQIIDINNNRGSG